MLRAVIFGLEGTLNREGIGFPSSLKGEIRRLFDFLRGKGVEPIVLSNRDWVATSKQTGVRYSVDQFLDREYGAHSLFITTRMNLPKKPKRDAVDVVLRQKGLANHEVIYVGMSKIDFQTAINSNLLFLNGTWDRQEVDYGFVFNHPKEIARFIDTFALKKHPWFYAINDPITYYSLAPFSTHIEAYKVYSAAARSAAKAVTPARHFFLRSIVGSLYFSGLTNTFDYIACVPGHEAGHGNQAMNDILDTIGKALRKKYLPDLIVRHMEAPKSQNLRNQNKKPSPLSQLNTIRLNDRPQKAPGEPYKHPLKLNGKGVLVFDDFCTSGYSLEAPRLFLEQTGASVTLVSWLKTINTGYEILKLKQGFNPFIPQNFTAADLTISVQPYSKFIVDRDAPIELGEAFERYRIWDYP